MAVFAPSQSVDGELSMALDLSILYRGSLSSCNYGCEYCPFAKLTNTAAELAQDRAELDRFIDWIGTQGDRNFGILFTPWGEALIHRYYQAAIARLSQLSHVNKVAIQTNLSCNLDWVEDCNKQTLALWTTFHPTEVAIDRFIAQCHELDRRNVRYSVGIVGLREHRESAQILRQELAPAVYLWVNAYKRQVDYYTAADIEFFTQIDRLFPINNRVYYTLAKPCRTGESVISVDGAGTIRRCHFIADAIGNIYEPDFDRVLVPRNCSNRVCRCHIGYVHLPELNLYEVYSDGILARIPVAGV
jgi:MoaA/NifB/PqqE/SkfB family radical SAM enzyme